MGATYLVFFMREVEIDLLLPENIVFILPLFIWSSLFNSTININIWDGEKSVSQLTSSDTSLD